MRRTKLLSVVLAAGLSLPAALSASPARLYAQTGYQAARANDSQARAALNAMVTALGGPAWLNMRNRMLEGQVAAFFHGNPDLGTTLLFKYHQWPDKDRIEATKHRDVVEFYIGNQGWEVTYRGKAAIEKDQLRGFLRRRDHSIETAVKAWMKNPKTILVYEGQHLAGTHLADKVSLISPDNETITILMDAETHLPLQRVFEWRDPTYHDLNTSIEQYDDYHLVDGIETPFTITRIENGETVRQFYVTRAEYNLNLPPDFWNVDRTARRIKRH